MSWNGSGGFNRIFSWVADKNASIDISSSRMDTDSNDIASNGFGNCLTRDGQGSATANLPMNTFKHTGLGNGSARTDSVALGQVQDGLINWVVAGGSSDAITATYSPALTALPDGQLCFIRATAANTTTTPTFNPSALGAHTITKLGGNALLAGDIIGNLAEIILRYNLANTRWELLNPSTAVLAPASVTNADMFTMNAWTLKGNNTGSGATPSDFTIDSLTAKASPLAADEVPIWDAAGAAMKKATFTAVASLISTLITAPTVQRFTSGTSLTYTPTAGIARIRVRMCGGGGGGSAANANSGTNGNDTSFGTWTAIHGNGGTFGSAGGTGGTGGTNGTGTLVMRLAGGSGGGGGGEGGQSGWAGAQGGSNPFGGGGGGGFGSSGGSTAGQAAAPNTGGGGGLNSSTSGSGGGAGEYVEFWMTAAQVGASQTYTVGASANGGAAGGQPGGNGAAGIIIVEEFYS